MNDIQTFINEMLDEHIKEHYKEIVSATYKIMQRFGLYDDESIRQFATKKKCSLAYTEDYHFIGVVVNNRWLYTTNGLIVGKKGKRWEIEKLKNE